MNLRKIMSLTALISFVLEMLTSVILYIMPQGRVAYWADWQLWGLSKPQWTDLHVNLGVLFLIAIVLHTWYNWPAISAYLKDKTRHLRIFTANFNLALLLSLLFCLGTYFQLPPFSSIIELGNHFKDEGALIYGEPPYGHAELSSLASFAKKTELDLETSLARMQEAGLKVVGGKQTLAEIARDNGITPKKLYEIMNPAVGEKVVSGGLPKVAPGGMGRLSLAELCQRYGLELAAVQEVLAENGLAASADLTIKEIGSRYERNPHDIYDLLAERFPG